MDDIQTRLKETSENCIESYSKWQEKMKDNAAREDLQSHIHELRKVASRLEIEIAMSERDKMASKRIPIPPHRSQKPSGGNNNQNNNKNQNNDAKKASNDGDDIAAKVKKTVRRTRKPKAASGEE